MTYKSKLQEKQKYSVEERLTLVYPIDLMTRARLPQSDVIAPIDEPLRGGERDGVDSQTDKRTPEEGSTEAVRETYDVRAHTTGRRHRDGRGGRHSDDPTAQSEVNVKTRLSVFTKLDLAQREVFLCRQGSHVVGK